MSKKKIVIFGLEKLAELAHIYMSEDRECPFEVVAFTVDREYVKEPTYRGLPVVPFEEVTSQYPPDQFDMYVGVGYTQLNKLRAQKYTEAKEKGYKLISYVCSKNTFWGDLEIGDNVFIFENQVIQPGTKIGNNVVLWSGNHFGHDVVLRDHCWVTSHCVLSGHSEVGEYSFLGVNTCVRDHVKIGPNNLIGSGAILLRDTKDGEVYITEQTKKYPMSSEQFFKMMDISRKKVS